MYGKSTYTKREKKVCILSTRQCFNVKDKQKFGAEMPWHVNIKMKKVFFLKPKEMLFKHWIFSQLMHRFVFKDDIEISRSYQFHQIFSEVTNLKEIHSASAEKNYMYISSLNIYWQ